MIWYRFTNFYRYAVLNDVASANTTWASQNIIQAPLNSRFISEHCTSINLFHLQIHFSSNYSIIIYDSIRIKSNYIELLTTIEGLIEFNDFCFANYKATTSPMWWSTVFRGLKCSCVCAIVASIQPTYAFCLWKNFTILPSAKLKVMFREPIS